VAVPMNGDPFPTVRSRVAGIAYYATRGLAVRVRTAPSDDGLSVLIWLEQKK